MSLKAKRSPAVRAADFVYSSLYIYSCENLASRNVSFDSVRSSATHSFLKMYLSGISSCLNEPNSTLEDVWNRCSCLC